MRASRYFRELSDKSDDFPHRVIFAATPVANTRKHSGFSCDVRDGLATA